MKIISVKEVVSENCMVPAIFDRLGIAFDCSAFLQVTLPAVTNNVVCQ